MSVGVKTIIFPVSDLARTKTLYGTVLGVEPYADAPYYLGYRIDGQDIGFDPKGHRAEMPGPVAYFHVKDIRSSLQSLLDAGAERVQDVRDVGGGRLIATVKDGDGNVFGLLQPE